MAKMNNEELIEALRQRSEAKESELTFAWLYETQGAMSQAADLIEAQQKRIAELEAQLPKEGEWIDMGDFEMCSVCKIAQRKKYRQYNGGFMWVRTDFCPKCGSRMAKGEQG